LGGVAAVALLTVLLALYDERGSQPVQAPEQKPPVFAEGPEELLSPSVKFQQAGGTMRASDREATPSPDLESIARVRQNLQEEWDTTRARVVPGFAVLDEERERYLSAKKELLVRFPGLGRPELLSGLETLQARYRASLVERIGEKAFLELAAARTKLIEDYRQGEYDIPLDTY